MYLFKTDQELVEQIKGFNKVQFASMKTSTPLRINKKSYVDKTPAENLYGPAGITVISELNVGVNYPYEKGVNNRREKEGKEADFEAKELPYGSWMEGSSIIILNNQGHPQLRVQYNTANKAKRQLIANGQPLTEEQKSRLHEFQGDPAKKKPKEKCSDTQGLDNPVVVRNFNICNINELHLDGEVYKRI